MLIRTEALVLAVIKYNDADAVVKTYTAEAGFTAFYIKGFFKGKKARQKKALFQPNALLEIHFEHKNKDSLAYIKEAALIYHYKSLNFDFDKLNISTFLREVLLESLKNEQVDQGLFRFVKQQFISLDQQAFEVDFHLFFLVHLMQRLGFSPDLGTKGRFFDLMNGQFTDNLPLGPYLNIEDTALFKYVLGMIFASIKKLKIDQNQRKRLLDSLMKYYAQHIAQFKIPKSLAVLNQLYK